MNKIKSVSTYTRQDESSGFWAPPTPLGADIENIDITNKVADGLDDNRATWSSLYQDSSLIVGPGDTGASAWSKFNKFRKRIATALAIYPSTDIAEEETWAQYFKKDILDKAHPVGSYYWSSEPTNPSGLFGGTWESVENKFIFAAGPGYTVGSTGGAEEVELEIANMPKHRHTLLLQSDSGTNEQYIKVGKYDGIAKGEAMKYGWEGWEGGTTSLAEGESIPHENMPPYIVAYCWHRTA